MLAWRVASIQGMVSIEPAEPGPHWPHLIGVRSRLSCRSDGKQLGVLHAHNEPDRPVTVFPRALRRNECNRVGI